jgi:hypothetical protein
MASSPSSSNVNVNEFQQQQTTRSWLQTIIDSSHLITFCISISVIIYGSFRSLTIDKENDSYTRQQQQFSKEKRERKRRSSSGVKKNLLEADSNEECGSDLGVEYEDGVDDDDDMDESDGNLNNQGDIHEHQSTQNIDSAQALFIPIAASISLLLMFFFFDSIQTAFVICTSGIRKKKKIKTTLHFLINIFSKKFDSRLGILIKNLEIFLVKYFSNSVIGFSTLH